MLGFAEGGCIHSQGGGRTEGPESTQLLSSGGRRYLPLFAAEHGAFLSRRLGDTK